MNKEKIIRIIITNIISAIAITFIHNLNLNLYIKDFLIPITILIINYLYTIKMIDLPTNKKAYYLLIPIILILMSKIIIHIDYSNIFLNIIIIPILLSIFFLKLVNNNYNISKNFLTWFFKLFPKNLFKNLNIIKLNTSNKNKINRNKIFNILKGLAIGIPISIILLSLLTSADYYFSIFIDNITNNIISFTNLNNIIKNIIIFLITFIILFSTFINITQNTNTKISNIMKKINNTTANTILIIINSVFILFLISEISKITTNFLHIPKEYTYALYAREGFFQLLIVTTINFSIIIYYLYYTDIIKENKLVKKLILILISFSILLIFNSYYRMFLYINAYGFTILRLQVLLFLLMELILFIILIKKITKDLKHQDAIIFTIIILSTYIINLYTCNNLFIDFINNLINK